MKKIEYENFLRKYKKFFNLVGNFNQKIPFPEV